MKKSIIGNLVFWSFLFVGVVFVSVMVYFTSYFEAFAIEQKSRILLNNVDDIETVTHVALTNQSDAMDTMFERIISTVSATTESAVTVFDNNGVILASSGQKIDQNSFELVSESVTAKVLSGEKLISVNIYRDTSGQKILTVGAPLLKNREIFGGVMFNQLVPEIKNVYSFFSRRMFYLFIVLILLSLALFGFLSIRVTSPVRSISAAVKEFSKGNFKKRVDYSSKNELGELAQNINDMASSLENLESLRSGFISDVTHELRTPLTTISGFVEGIIDGTIPKESQNEYLEVVLSESKRLSRLITNLVQVTKMESGQIKPHKTDFDINELVRQSLVKFERMITPKNIEVSLNIDDGKHMVNADRDNISQVLINLINNAVKFTPNGGKIAIDITERKNKIYVSVENTGVGIKPEEIKHIWDRFYKSDKSRSEERTGMGLGLYIVRRIINMHKETITVESEPNKSTIFTFTLTSSGES